MLHKKHIVVLLVVLSILPNPIFGAPWWESPGVKTYEIGWKSIFYIFFGPNIPDIFLESVFSIFQWLIFPFIAVWTVIYGIIDEIRIFRNFRINVLISFLVAAIAGPTGGLVFLTRTIFVVIGWWGMLLFGAITLIGFTIWGRGRAHEMGGWGGLTGRNASEYLKLTERMEQERRAIRAAQDRGDWEEMRKHMKNYRKFQTDRQKIKP